MMNTIQVLPVDIDVLMLYLKSYRDEGADIKLSYKN